MLPQIFEEAFLFETDFKTIFVKLLQTLFFP